MEPHDLVLALHIAAGATGLVLGAVVIWLSRERPLLDRRSTAYHWTVLAVSLTAVGLVAFDPSGLWWIAILAVLAYGLAVLGYLAPRSRFRGWEPAYAHGQGGSYIALVTALLVVALTVDGPIHGVAEVVVWLLPVVIGTHLILRWDGRLRRAARRPG
jgi:hypothetical protein